MAQGRKVMKQLDTAPGLIGWSLAANLPTLEFFTLSASETPRASAPRRTEKP